MQNQCYRNTWWCCRFLHSPPLCVHLLYSLFSMGSGISVSWFPTRPTIRLAVPFVEQKRWDKSYSLFSVWFTSSITINCEILSNIIVSSFQWLHVHLYVTEFHCWYMRRSTNHCHWFYREKIIISIKIHTCTCISVWHGSRIYLWRSIYKQPELLTISFLQTSLSLLGKII